MTRAHADEDEAPNPWLETDETDKSQAEPGDDVREWPKPTSRSDLVGGGIDWKLPVVFLALLAFVGFFGEPIGKLAAQVFYGGGAQPQ